MKNYLLLPLLILFISLNACKKEKAESSEKKEAAPTYLVDVENSSVQWTAYKTSEKVPVKGTFTEIKITKSNSGSNQLEAIKGLEFEIPVTSIFSKDSIRDGKLNKFFFDIMKNTSNLKGTFSIADAKEGKINLTMNGLSKDLPFQYSIQDDVININALMNLDTWETQAALAALNEACKKLHTGADGINKTWNEVAIQAQIKTIVKE